MRENIFDQQKLGTENSPIFRILFSFFTLNKFGIEKALSYNFQDFIVFTLIQNNKFLS